MTNGGSGDEFVVVHRVRHAGYAAFVAEATAALGDALGIPAERVYVRFSDIPVWSVGDMLVDRRMIA